MIDEEENPEEFMVDVYKYELGTDLETMDSGVAIGLVDFTQDSEYKRLYESKSNEKTMERKGAGTCSTKKGRQNSEGSRC